MGKGGITVKALCWHGRNDIRYETVPDPVIEAPRDAILKVSTCAICGSDLHLFDGFMPGMRHGDVLGHEFMGEVVDVGPAIREGNGDARLRVGDRVVVPFTIICGECEQCRRGNFSCCERSNRNAHIAEKIFGHSTAGLFGYTQLTGGYAGGQAEYVRVPFADASAIHVPPALGDEQVLFLGDILPTGWQAAVQCDIQPADTVAIWGAGPVGQMAIRSVVLLGARRVICIDNLQDRLSMAEAGGATTVNYDEEGVADRLNELTGGKGPDKCIDAVGMEAHAARSLDSMMDRVRRATRMESDRPHVLREMMIACRPAGVISIAGVYGGLIDKIPFGAAMNKGITIRMGQTHVNRWADDLLRRIGSGQIDPSFVITHTASLADGARMYRKFRDKEDGCIKVVLRPESWGGDRLRDNRQSDEMRATG